MDSPEVRNGDEVTDQAANDDYSLHEAVFHGHQVPENFDYTSDQINLKDIHGNTPLHLAVILGRHDWLNQLLKSGANILAKNRQGWTPLAEAISYGNRSIIKKLLKKVRRQSHEDMERRIPEITKTLESIGSFYMELKWDFQSWIPLVSRILPSDVCKIYKKGSKLRLDSTLIDFNERKWVRGDISFIYNNKLHLNRTREPSDACKVCDIMGMYMTNKYNDRDEVSTPQQNNHKCHHHHHHRNSHHSNRSSSKNSISLLILDNKKCSYRVSKVDVGNIEHEVDLIMSSDIVSAQLNIDSINFHRASSGWLFKSEKSEKVGSFMADFYSISGITLETRKRREHLNEEDVQRNRACMASLSSDHSRSNYNQDISSSLESYSNDSELAADVSLSACDNELSNGNHSSASSSLRSSSNCNTLRSKRASLPPPEETNVSWNEYINSPIGQYPTIGRPQVSKSSSKSFKASIAMSTEFPLTVEMLLNLLDVLAPFKHLSKLREFCRVKLPPGFPVKIDMPILPTMTARVTFQEFAFQDNLPDSLFEIPDSFVEEATRF